MPEAFASVLAQEGLGALVAITLLAGTVYGFAGFGAALIFMPVALVFLAPQEAVVVLSVSSLASFVALVPQAWRECDRRATLTLLLSALVMIPVGLWVLRFSDPVLLRWAVSGLVLATLALMLAGWRYRSRPGLAAWVGIGGLVGFLGGSTGLNGPVLVLFQLGGQEGAVRSRANTIVVLTLTSLSTMPLLALQGGVEAPAIYLGLALFLPYLLGTALGRHLFRPERGWLFRGLAYVLIGLAGVMGLPIY